MIQRIQTLFLFLAAVAIGDMFFFPFAEMITLKGEIYMFWFDGLRPAEQNIPGVFVDTLPLIILMGLSGIIPLINIFLYKKRVLQMRLCIFDILLMAGLLGLEYFYLDHARDLVDATIHYNFPVILPVAGIILLYLAFRGIRKDELLIKSIDRLR
mgnify:FL=1